MSKELGQASVFVIVGRAESVQNERFEKWQQLIVWDAVDGLPSVKGPSVRRGTVHKLSEDSRTIDRDCREEIQGGALMPCPRSSGQRGFEGLGPVLSVLAELGLAAVHFPFGLDERLPEVVIGRRGVHQLSPPQVFEG
ncbi:hypothetical protein ACFV5G_29565 [Streptomyces sp. NPDC059766]|uniref:hypothetical protein n=1 Tax=Streptomyces sp. NPDC059766 TaxID=3346940 RepID=UPI003667C5A7